MDISENNNKKTNGPHLYSTPPFARSTLSSASSTSLLHRPRVASSMQPLNIAAPNLGPVNISSVNSKLVSSMSPKKTPDNEMFKHQREQAHGTSSHLGDSPHHLRMNDKFEPRFSNIDTTKNHMLPAAIIKDEKQAKRNDMILQERIMEAKSMNPKAVSGATVHKFSLWNGLKNKNSVMKDESDQITQMGINKEDAAQASDTYQKSSLKGRIPKQTSESKAEVNPTKLPSSESFGENSKRSYSGDKAAEPIIEMDKSNSTPRSRLLSIRSKVDSASKAMNKSDTDSHANISAIPMTIPKKHSFFYDRRQESESTVRDDDFDDGYATPSKSEEEELLNVVPIRPLTDPYLPDDKLIGRPPLPGINKQSQDGNSKSKSTKNRSNYHHLMDEKVPVLPNQTRGSQQMNSQLFSIGDPELQLNSSISSSDDYKVIPSGVSKFKIINRQESKLISREFNSAPGSPISSPRNSIDGLPHRIIAFKNRSTSNSVSSSPIVLGNIVNSNSSNPNGNSKIGKIESPSFGFIPIRDAAPSAPESRSNSIFQSNGREFTSNLTLSLSCMESIEMSVCQDVHSKNQHRRGDEKRPIQQASPDYSGDAFELPSPALSVMTHMSEDVVDRYEHLYTGPVSNNPSPKSIKKSNPFANAPANPLAGGNSNTNTLAPQNIFRRFSNMNVQEKRSHQEKESFKPSEVEAVNASVKDDEISEYAEIAYVCGDGEHTLRWQKGAPIGEGTFGRVYKGMDEKSGELAAVKQLGLGNGSEGDIEVIRREIRVMRQLDHENIVRYYGAARSNRYLFIILEFISGGSIASMLQQFGPFSESLIRKFSYQIVCGLDYLHGKGIIHRDIKGANVLVTDTGIAKIADFGCSKQLAGLCTTSLEESLRAIRGSVPWMAPEVIKQSGHGLSSDIWSVGATVIEMATGKPPWSAYTNNLAALFHVATSKDPPPVPPHLSRTCAVFLSKCMMVDPSCRATAQALLNKDEFLISEREQSNRRSRSSSMVAS